LPDFLNEKLVTLTLHVNEQLNLIR